MKNIGKWLWSVKFETLWVILGIVFIFKLPRLLFAADDTAAGLDPGVLSFIAVAVVAVVVAVLLFFCIIKLAAPNVVDEWWDSARGFAHDWNNTTAAVRLSLSIGLLIGVILAVALVTAAAF